MYKRSWTPDHLRWRFRVVDRVARDCFGWRRGLLLTLGFATMDEVSFVGVVGALAPLELGFRDFAGALSLLLLTLGFATMDEVSFVSVLGALAPLELRCSTPACASSVSCLWFSTARDCAWLSIRKC